MHLYSGADIRTMIPRWRSLELTPNFEIVSAKNLNKTSLSFSNGKAHLAKFVAEWKRAPSLITASDLLDAAFVFGQNKETQEAALFVMTNKNYASEGLLTSAKCILFNHWKSKSAVSTLENISHEIALAKIRHIKSILIDAPRDSIALTELARMYAYIGQTKQSEASLERALKLTPDNRYILRSAANFFSNNEKHEKALSYIWKSESVKSDPWIQAAEIALTTRSSKGPRFAGKQLRHSKTMSVKSHGASELLLGLASLEFKNGAKNKYVRKLVENSLPFATENGLAQAVWIGDQAGFELPTYQLLKNTPRAFEASYYSLMEEEKYDRATVAAISWKNDQPLSPDASIEGAYTASVLIGDHSKGIEIANDALATHPNNFTIHNNLYYSQIVSGDVSGGLDTLKKLRHLADSEYRSMYLYAATGLLAYAVGDVEAGGAIYERTCELANEQKDASSLIRAVIHWAEQDSKYANMDAKEFDDLSTVIDKRLKSYSANDAKDIKRLWKVKKETISASIAQSSLIEGNPSSNVSAEDFIKKFSDVE